MSDFIAIIAVLIILVGGILFLIESFKESIIWGLACLFISPVALAFTVLHWDVAKKPFLMQLIGLGLLLMGTS